ncbi:MAG: hypothetical protein M3007_00915, partial [Candidatus Eremiobacteraeota bacterium]|nr:hypothetical protein [Candidatus Eremiobacteraeota bacterium]
MKRTDFLLLALTLAAVAAVVLYRTTAGHTALRPFAARIIVSPKQAAVFRGDSLQFEAAVVGAARPYTVTWSVIGPGTIDDSGLYQAPDAPAVANVVASAGAGLADSATVQTVTPPNARRSLAVVSCYDDATIDVRDAADIQQLGSLSLRGRTAGVAIDARTRRALIAADAQVYALNLTSMRWKASKPLANVRFSQAALLAGGLFAVTDNDAQNGSPGVRIFRIDSAGVPLLVSSIAAGETPEGIAVADDGRMFY